MSCDPSIGRAQAEIVAAALWRRLDGPGHDACRLERLADGWRLRGTTAFREEGDLHALAYAVECDADWRAWRGSVRGWRGTREVDLVVERTARGAWTLGGAEVPGLEACVDLDFGITPATNLQQLRRMSLAVGESADITVAWLDGTRGEVVGLPQHYERRSEHAYWYESPQGGYEAMLELAPSGFVRHYPRLWVIEDGDG